jgi:hypothetical protein
VRIIAPFARRMAAKPWQDADQQVKAGTLRSALVARGESEMVPAVRAMNTIRNLRLYR